MRILLTGASGYIGGRLAPALLEAGHEVRCLARNPDKLSEHSWRNQVEVVAGDVLGRESLDAALEGCDSAFYLVHSMGEAGASFADRDRLAADNFAAAASAAGLGRIVYLGGLGGGEDLSEHLASRQEVGSVLRSGSTPVTEVRAAVIIGSGSVSFEMMRYLTEVLPVMITPRWVRTRCQPIAIRNVLEILAAAIADDGAEDQVWEVGGPDQLSYEQMMRIYADEAGLRRRVIIPVPLLSPQLSRHWIGLVTPLPAGVAKPLVNSLRNEVTVSDNSLAEEFCAELEPFGEAVRSALRSSLDADVVTRWSDAAPSPAQAQPSDPTWAGGTLNTDERTVDSTASPDDVFWAFSRIGGDVGYYAHDWAWRLRGVIDSLVGGVGLRRGRRHPEQLRLGEALDFWRVAALEPPRRLQLAAEMKLPGDAWLEFTTQPTTTGTSLRQTAYFKPRGLFGRLYWLALTPLHSLIFRRMAQRIAATAETRPPRSTPHEASSATPDPQIAR
ncbi:MAG: SDR family oxidoreductase [Actinomycetota bacterium]|nr:SDR family oxidoreductase [Actinomycetota bacterium]